MYRPITELLHILIENCKTKKYVSSTVYRWAYDPKWSSNARWRQPKFPELSSNPSIATDLHEKMIPLVKYVSKRHYYLRFKRASRQQWVKLVFKAYDYKSSDDHASWIL